MNSATKTRRIRRYAEQARAEILDAAEALLAEQAYGELTVENLMARTGMTRSAFYHYFSNREAVMIALLGRIESDLRKGTLPYLKVDTELSPRKQMRRAIESAVDTFGRHAVVISGVNQAAQQHDAVEAYWRCQIIEPYIGLLADLLRDQHAAGQTPIERPDEIAHALLLMNSSLVLESINRDKSLDGVAETLSSIWLATLYPE
jgi:AcrR family transcriptional regulator